MLRQSENLEVFTQCLNISKTSNQILDIIEKDDANVVIVKEVRDLLEEIFRSIQKIETTLANTLP